MSKVTQIVKSLKEKGLVYWEHEGNGENGTYIRITEKGSAAAKKQQEILVNCLKVIIRKLGQKKIIEILSNIEQIETLIINCMEEGDKNG